MKQTSTASLAEEFREQVRANFFNEIRPANTQTRQTPQHIALVTVAQAYFERGDLDHFSSFLRESQYFTDLWTAHMIMEHGQPGEAHKAQALEVIRKYAKGCMNPEIIAEEKSWLAVHGMGN
ncbi:hypothetical protein [Dinghuibacter silviterrae]|uniref:Uncharacterized protein n=1 Tax=Dinghuibacter silviterrae TaxID=1539049 RepID=A0A4R8DPJ9_9BACT|nr:hypothetical protein [Dinghuibacter silviterrae]TDW99788.1 hypothetical protein EDB95_0799 [Dinghuibacter silviterrae]